MDQTKVTVFNNEEFGKVRTVTIDGEPWIVGKDVATALGYADTFGALKKHVMDSDKLVCQIDSAGQKRDVTVINESGVYTLIFGSKLKSAERFKHWVTSEVLPCIRKNGIYATDNGHVIYHRIITQIGRKFILRLFDMAA